MSGAMQKAHTIVIFGASGDLTHRKLVPALYNLYRKKRLAANTRIIGFARRPYDDQAFRDLMEDGTKEFSLASYSAEIWAEFAPLLHYFCGNLTDAEDFHGLSRYLDEVETGPSDRLYYLATSPEFYQGVVESLGAAGLAGDGELQRNLVVEKPFGRNLSSAQELNKAIHQVFMEDQVFRIDHYLGKETAQNILFFRFANTIFEPVWNRGYVDNIQITVLESVDVGHRAGYYDSSGVLRDMFQNHLMQLYTLIAMEPPASFDANALRNEKVKVLNATRPILMENTVLGQYEGYIRAQGVASGSRTPTFGAIKLYLDNWRWQGVPFYLRSGKAMASKTSEIIVVFQRPPHVMFDLPDASKLTSNILSICIQPDEGIHLKFETKLPDSNQDTRSVEMEFHYRSSFGDGALPEAYERLLMDAISGDASLFARSDEIETAWKLIDPVISTWESKELPPLAMYPVKSWGPRESEELMGRTGRIWRLGCAEYGVSDVENP